jgi:hypothetical protein
MARLRPHRPGPALLSAADITPANVAQLAVAWTSAAATCAAARRSGGNDVRGDAAEDRRRLYLCTPHQRWSRWTPPAAPSCGAATRRCSGGLALAAPDLPRPFLPGRTAPAAAATGGCRPHRRRRQRAAGGRGPGQGHRRLPGQALHAHRRRPPDRARPASGAVCTASARHGPDQPVGRHAQRAAWAPTTRRRRSCDRRAGDRRRHGAGQRLHHRAVGRDPRLRRRQRRAGVELGPGRPDDTAPHRRRPDLHAQLAQQLVDLKRGRNARHGLRADGQPAARPVGRQAQRRGRASIRRPWWPWSWPPARCAGCFRPCTTTCGTTTCLRNPCWST